jgi:DNA-binding GntR family transcriptional regulator
LQEQGLVMNSPRRGMFVVLLEDEDIAKINSVRLILEPEAFRLARTRMTKSDESRLLQLLERLEKSGSASPAVRARNDFEFHRAIWNLTGNEYLERTLHGLTAPLFAHAVLKILRSDQVKDIVVSHRPLMAFLQNKLKTDAGKLIAEHLRIPWAGGKEPVRNAR